jgi:hypothetical protein
MSTIAIDATNPSTTVNLAVLKKALDKIIDAHKINGPVTLANDEFILINEIRFAVSTGVASARVVSAVTMTY